MIRHIFCDLDGTLIKDFKNINETDIVALKEAQKNGILVSIATGRLDYEIKMLMNKYNFKGFRLSQNGAVVFDHNDLLLHNVNLETKDILDILNEIKAFNVLTLYQTIDKYYVEEKLPIIEEFEKSQPYITYNENKRIKNELDNYNISTISLWCEKNKNIEIKKHLDKVLPNYLTIYISSEFTIDITSKLNSKGNAIKHVCNLNNISLNEIAAIGDSQNDISMFNNTNNSFVMSLARDDVKKYANYTVDSVKEAVSIILEK